MSKIFKSRYGVDLKSFLVKKVLLDPARRERAQTDREGTWMEIMRGPLREFAEPSHWKGQTFYEDYLRKFRDECK